MEAMELATLWADIATKNFQTQERALPLQDFCKQLAIKASQDDSVDVVEYNLTLSDGNGIPKLSSFLTCCSPNEKRQFVVMKIGSKDLENWMLKCKSDVEIPSPFCNIAEIRGYVRAGLKKVARNTSLGF